MKKFVKRCEKCLICFETQNKNQEFCSSYCYALVPPIKQPEQYEEDFEVVREAPQQFFGDRFRKLDE